MLALFGCFTFVYGYLEENEIISSLIEYYERNPDTLLQNEYEKEIDIDFVKYTDDFDANNKQELINLSYTNCINDIVSINNDSVLLSQLNNFVNVFNSFRSIKTTYTTSGKVTLAVNRIYSNDDIQLINSKLDEIEKEIYVDADSEYDKILAIHNYIINHTKYNLEDENKSGTTSSTAIGVLVKNLATCNGYTDTAALLLDRLNIKNVRISNQDHIWNLVYTGDKWLHMDLTWDDPVNKLNVDILSHDYFLKTTLEFDEMGKNNDKNKHEFDRNVYNFIEKATN